MRYKVKYLKSNSLEQTTLTASSPQEAKEILLSKGYTPLSIQEVPSLLRFFPIPRKDVIASLYQLSLMLSSSLPLSQALSLLQDNSPNPRLRQIYASISNAVENGSSLSEAFAPHVGVFGGLCIALIESGSKSGQLDHTLKLLIHELQTQEKNTKNLKKALLYPSVVLFSTLCCFVFVLKFVLPSFSTLFSHSSLPLSTRILLSL